MKRKRKSGAPEWVDPDDAPLLTEDFFENAEISVGDKVVRRGRPPADFPKELISLRLDQDVLQRLRAFGPGWQTQVNQVLRRYVKSLD